MHIYNILIIDFSTLQSFSKYLQVMKLKMRVIYSNQRIIMVVNTQEI